MNVSFTTTSLLIWTAPVVSLFWKRRMMQGGSSIAKRVKKEALQRKRRKRKRLADFLRDDLLRRKMMQDFQAKMTEEQCEERIEELEILAAQEVTADDVRVSTDDILDGVMGRIWLGLIAWLGVGYLLCGEEATEFMYIVVFLLWVVIQTIDNSANLGTFERLSCCGTKPPKGNDDEDDVSLLYV